jgi:hypothetical protein
MFTPSLRLVKEQISGRSVGLALWRCGSKVSPPARDIGTGRP